MRITTIRHGSEAQRDLVQQGHSIHNTKMAHMAFHNCSQGKGSTSTSKLSVMKSQNTLGQMKP